jgi:hypothetical protein
MDITLGGLRIPDGAGGCVRAGRHCPDNEAFERLVSELSVAVAPTVLHGAATFGPAGFYLGVTAALTPISAAERQWTAGTEGTGGVGDAPNKAPASVLSWNRLQARKGLPFGFELGASVGQGVLTSMWVVGGELKWALFEGFHSGWGALPDVSLSGTLQAAIGAESLALRTDALAATVSKPLVLANRYRLTPLASLQLLMVRASTGRVDLTPSVDDGELNSAQFQDVSQTRTRVFLGAELAREWFVTSLTLGFDATVPTLKATTPNDNADGPLSRQVTFQLALGARY